MGDTRGHADWYDATFRSLVREDGSAGLLGGLLGPADPENPICLDVGCGTGSHFAALAARGYQVVGVDLSADQLRIARTRAPGVVRADAGRLPFADRLIPAAAMTFIHTDVEDFPAVIAEAARVLRPAAGWSTSASTPPSWAHSLIAAPRSRSRSCASDPATATNGGIGMRLVASPSAAGSARAT